MPVWLSLNNELWNVSFDMSTAHKHGKLRGLPFRSPQLLSRNAATAGQVDTIINHGQPPGTDKRDSDPPHHHDHDDGGLSHHHHPHSSIRSVKWSSFSIQWVTAVE